MKNFITYDLSIQFYKDCKALRLPRHVKDQFDRASLSICLNLAEVQQNQHLKIAKNFITLHLDRLESHKRFSSSLDHKILFKKQMCLVLIFTSYAKADRYWFH
jgi:hypothetical protein